MSSLEESLTEWLQRRRHGVEWPGGKTAEQGAVAAVAMGRERLQALDDAVMTLNGKGVTPAISTAQAP